MSGHNILCFDDGLVPHLARVVPCSRLAMHVPCQEIRFEHFGRSREVAWAIMDQSVEIGKAMVTAIEDPARIHWLASPGCQ